MISRMTRLFSLLLVFASCTATAQVGFSPQYYDLTLAEAQGTHAYRIFNLTKDPKQVRVSVVSWDFDESGEIRILPSTDTTLDQWVVVNPVEFTIPPGESQAVRFSIRPAVQLSAGEHRAMLIFDEVLQPQAPGEASGAGAQTALRARFQFRTAVYCQVGTVSRMAEVVSVHADANTLTVQTRATGTANTRFDGQFMIWKAAAFPGLEKTSLLGNLTDAKPELPPGMVAAGRLPGQPVLPGGTRKYEVNLGTRLSRGHYVGVLLGRFGDDALSRQISFDVAAN
jgi:fimbrial chaperone protein